jgi:hypothetical protein
MAKTRSGLASHFSLASEDVRHRTVASLEGEVGTGKTYFGLTGPAPIVTFNIDQGLEGVVEQFRKEGKEIYEEKYLWIPGDPEDEEDSSGDLQDLAKEIRGKFEKDVAYALKNGARTLLVDTESRFWQVFRYAEFGSPKGDNPRDFDELNQRFESWINKVKASDANLFLVRSMKDKWGAFGPVNKKTGKKGFGKSGREVWGYEHLAGMMFMELAFEHITDPKHPAYDEAFPYQIRFGKCRHNADLQFTYTPRCSFGELGELLVEGSSREDWEE